MSTMSALSVPAASYVERLLFALVHAQLYGPGHARVREAAADVSKAVRERCEREHTSATLLGVVAGQVVVDGKPLLGASLSARRLLQRIEAVGAGGVELGATTSADDVTTLVEVLARRAPVADLRAANADLLQRRVRAVRFVAPWDGGDAAPAAAVASGDERTAVLLHQDTVDLLQGLTIAACHGRELDVSQVEGVVDRMVEGLDRDAGVLHGLARYPEYDFFTFGHSIRVALLCLEVARRTTTDRALLHRIGTAALLHDVGKALVRWEVLHKQGSLSAEERREMQRHPVLGGGILLANRDSDPLAVAAAYGHHCAPGGHGYPRSCDEFHQGVVTRLVRVCDVFEALTAVRPYKPAMSPARAIRTMLAMREGLDEALLGTFVRVVGLHPPGTRVLLDDGSVGRVVSQTDDFHRPLVEVVAVDGVALPLEARRRVDLRVPGEEDPRRIVGPAPELEVTTSFD